MSFFFFVFYRREQNRKIQIFRIFSTKIALNFSDKEVLVQVLLSPYQRSYND